MNSEPVIHHPPKGPKIQIEGQSGPVTPVSPPKQQQSIATTGAPPSFGLDTPIWSEVSAKLFPEHGADAIQKVPPSILYQLEQLAERWGITRLFKERLPNLYGKEFVFLFDDSGSMRNTDEGATISRWLELKEFAANAIALGSAFDSDGVDVYFLNRPKVPNVKNISQLDEVFAKDPTDYDLTPISVKVNEILDDHRQKFKKGNLVLVIATDGEPKSNDGTDSVAKFIRTLKIRHQRVGVPELSTLPVNIRACTNEAASIGYLKRLDNDESLFLDVTDDYNTELSQLQSVLGNDFPFSFGDYTLKSLLGAVDQWMDKTDEPKHFTEQEIRYQKLGEIPTKPRPTQSHKPDKLPPPKKKCLIQ